MMIQIYTNSQSDLISAHLPQRYQYHWFLCCTFGVTMLPQGALPRVLIIFAVQNIVEGSLCDEAWKMVSNNLVAPGVCATAENGVCESSCQDIINNMCTTCVDGENQTDGTPFNSAIKYQAIKMFLPEFGCEYTCPNTCLSAYANAIAAILYSTECQYASRNCTSRCQRYIDDVGVICRPGDQAYIEDFTFSTLYWDQSTLQSLQQIGGQKCDWSKSTEQFIVEPSDSSLEIIIITIIAIILVVGLLAALVFILFKQFNKTPEDQENLDSDVHPVPTSSEEARTAGYSPQQIQYLEELIERGTLAFAKYDIGETGDIDESILPYLIEELLGTSPDTQPNTKTLKQMSLSEFLHELRLLCHIGFGFSGESA